MLANTWHAHFPLGATSAAIRVILALGLIAFLSNILTAIAKLNTAGVTPAAAIGRLSTTGVFATTNMVGFA
jgi:hypothetical protein